MLSFEFFKKIFLFPYFVMLVAGSDQLPQTSGQFPQASVPDTVADGVWKLPDGEAFYNSQPGLFTTRDDLTATDIHQGDITPVAECYIVWSGRAVSCKIDMSTDPERRTLAQTELGDDFDRGGFRDLVLTPGALPLSLVTERAMA